MPVDSVHDLLNNPRLGFKLLFESNPYPMWIFDEDTLTFLAVNDAAIKKYGFSKEEFLNMRISDIRSDYNHAVMQQAVMRPGDTYGPTQTWHRKRDGTGFAVEVTAQSLLVEGAHFRLGLIRDMTEKLEDTKKIHESEALFHAVFQQASVGISVMSLDGRYLNANAKFCQITGYSLDELTRLSHVDITHPDDQHLQQTATHELRHGETHSHNWEKRYIRKNGAAICVRLSSSMMYDADGKPQNYVTTVEDITAEREARTQIAEQASWIDRAHDAIIVCDLDHRIQFWNGGAEALYGWTKEESLGKFVNDLLDSEPEKFAGAVKRILVQGDWRGEIKKRHKSGSEKTVQSHWSLINDEEGQPKSILIISTDITERLALERQLRQSQRLEALGQLTGGIAHDFNNLLTVILGSLEMLAEGIADRPDQLELAETASAAAQRGAELTRQLLAFTQRQMLTPRPVNVNSYVSESIAMIRRALREEVEIKAIDSTELWNTSIDVSQFQNALLNLCINASDAMSGPGLLQIETRNIFLDEDYQSRNEGVAAGAYVMVAVSDDGSGISRENLARVFDPFFTTKGPGKGTGLGLSMVYGFVKQSHGHIKVYSELGLGTTVKMYFPKSEDSEILSSVRTESALHDSNPSLGSEKILLVEDDDLVRRQAEGQLDKLGYRVISASNGAEALEIIRQTPDIDLLLTDVIMPGSMNGRELAENARQLRPELKILYSSGYTENILYSDGRLDPSCLVLSKPYSRLELAEKIRAALSERTSP